MLCVWQGKRLYSASAAKGNTLNRHQNLQIIAITFTHSRNAASFLSVFGLPFFAALSNKEGSIFYDGYF